MMLTVSAETSAYLAMADIDRAEVECVLAVHIYSIRAESTYQMDDTLEVRGPRSLCNFSELSVFAAHSTSHGKPPGQ